MKYSSSKKTAGMLLLAISSFVPCAANGSTQLRDTGTELNSAVSVPWIHVGSFDVVMTLQSSSASVMLTPNPDPNRQFPATLGVNSNQLEMHASGMRVRPTENVTAAGVEDLSNALASASNDSSKSEVPYSGPILVSPVPEPEIWAMMLVGAGLVGFRLRHRSKKFAANRFG